MQLPSLAVQDRDGEHPVELLDQPLRAPLRVTVREDLAVAIAGEPIAALLEPFLQGSIVIDLAILEGDDQVAPAVERLLPAGEVDDREAAHGHADGAVDVQPFPVGPPRAHHPRHRGDEFRRDVSPDRVDHSDDSTHDRGLPLSQASRKILA